MTAIVVDSEVIAAEIVAHAPELGVAIPDQLSVVRPESEACADEHAAFRRQLRAVEGLVVRVDAR